MMQVRMVTTAAGPDGVWPAGSVANVDRDQADVLVRFGYATAVAPPPERAVLSGKQVIEITDDAPAETRLSDVNGIGKATEQSLWAVGIEGLQDLLDASVDDVAAAAGTNNSTVAKWRKQAERLIG